MKKNFIRTISLVLALVMSFSLMTTAFAAETDVDTDNDDLVVWYDENGNPVEFDADGNAIITDDDLALVTSFKDVKSSAWYYNDVTECAKLGIVSGYSDGTFKPENKVTSVQLLTMLTRTFYASKLDQVTAPKGSAWYYANTKVAADVGMSTDMKAIDDKPINRYEMAVVIRNTLIANNKSVTYNERDKAKSAIKDYQNIPTNYRTPVLHSYAKGIITGMSDGTFSGTQNMTRAQACTVIMRMLKLINNYNPGDKDNNQYDDGKNQNTGNTGNNQNQNTSTGTGKLTNGKDATVANVTAMLNDLQRKWPTGTPWGPYGTANNNSYVNGDKDGDIKTLKNQIGNPLCATSLTYACGGFMRMISDSIFGITGAPCRELTDPSQIRPGDMLINYKKDGTLLHCAIVISVGTPYVGKNTGKTIYPVVTGDGNDQAKVYWGINRGIDGLGAASYTDVKGQYYRAYTRYPA